jgi:hypothetical protein
MSKNGESAVTSRKYYEALRKNTLHNKQRWEGVHINYPQSEWDRM